VRDKPDDNPQPPPAGTAGRVLITCEGAYGNGNASLYVYNPAADSLYENVYEAVNGAPVGDILQSITPLGDLLFLCVNNSGKVAAIRKDNYQIAGTISLKQPRYILPISAAKAYVSALYSHYLYVINPQTLQLTDSVWLPAKNVEGMLLLGTTAYICPWDTATDKVYQVNITNNRITDSVAVRGRAPQCMVQDKEQNIWVLSGNAYQDKPAALTRFDPHTGQVLASFLFPQTDVLKLTANAAGDTLYFIEADYLGGTANNGIYRMDIAAAALPAVPFVAAAPYQYFWALGIHPASGHIYVGDPMGFNQRGYVSVYTPAGLLLRQLKVGVGPGSFFFEE
jgi:DNA-binding beta-propeller fold protein YncE